MIPQQCLPALVVCFSLSLALNAQSVLYISPVGKGTSFSITDPGGLENLNIKIGELKKTQPGNIKVMLKGGTYTLENTISLSWQQQRGDTTTVLITNVAGEKVILSGGVQIRNWIAEGNGIYKARVPEGLRFRQLYIDGKMAVRARYPNRENEYDFGPYRRIQRFDLLQKRIGILATDFPFQHSNEGLELVTNQHWYQSRVRVAATEKIKDTVFVTGQQPEAQIFFGMTSYNMHLPGKPFYLENARELLDAPDEWFLDYATGWLYYKPQPGSDPNNSTVIAPQLQTLLRVQGAGSQPITGLQLKGIDFRYSTWLMPDRRGSIATQGAQQRKLEDSSGSGMIELAFVHRFRMEQCQLMGAGAHGLVLAKGVQNSTVTRNHFTIIGANAIVIDTDKKAVQADSVHCTQNNITYNLIENMGMHYTNGMGILASNISKHVIAHNEIRYGRYTGMQIGNHYGDNLSRLRDNRIEHNNIHHVMLLHDDGGAIYTLSNQPGTKILKNWIHDYGKCPWADSYPVNGIFLDNNSSYILVSDNVFSNLKDVDRLKENIGTTIHDNEFRNNASQDPEIIRAAGL